MRPNDNEECPDEYLPTVLRERASALAAQRPDEALRIAESIEDAWLRCQARAIVGANLPDRVVAWDVIRAALADARSLEEPSQCAAVSAWPVRAMIRTGHPDVLETVRGFAELAAREPHPVRRADALAELFEAAYPAGPEVFSVALDPLLDASRVMRSWKKSRHLRNLACVVAEEHPELAERILDIAGTGPPTREARKYVRQARRWIEEGVNLGPRDYVE